LTDRVEAQLDAHVRERLDRVRVRLAKAREDLAAAETTCERLGRLVDDLKAEEAGWAARVEG
jgi:predicted  nucleic acid-binding Zn-ribbon protein